jgi:hypothetical protein
MGVERGKREAMATHKKRGNGNISPPLFKSSHDMQKPTKKQTRHHQQKQTHERNSRNGNHEVSIRGVQYEKGLSFI